VIQRGAYIPQYGKTEEAWKSVNTMFFSQSETAHLKDGWYCKGQYRKLRDQFNRMRAEASKHPGYPSFRVKNLSAIQEDEPNKFICLIRQI